MIFKLNLLKRIKLKVNNIYFIVLKMKVILRTHEMVGMILYKFEYLAYFDHASCLRC